MSFTLGAIPQNMTVNLSTGADFIQTIHTASGDDWPVGTVVELRFSDGTVWPATVTDDELAWNKDKADVETLLLTSPRLKVKLFYVNGAVDLLWASGSVSVRG